MSAWEIQKADESGIAGVAAVGARAAAAACRAGLQATSYKQLYGKRAYSGHYEAAGESETGGQEWTLPLAAMPHLA
jgi:hypothetical protein